MFGFIKRLFGRKPETEPDEYADPPFRAFVKAGERGRYRWTLRDAAGKVRAVAPPRGWETAADAKADILSIMPGVPVYEEGGYD